MSGVAPAIYVKQDGLEVNLLLLAYSQLLLEQVYAPEVKPQLFPDESVIYEQ